MSTNTEPVPKPDVLEDPYADIPDRDAYGHQIKVRISHDIPELDKLFIQSINPGRGVLQAMANLFFKAVLDECRARGITNYHDHYDQFIAIIRRRTAPFTLGQGHDLNDSGGASSVHNPTSKQPAKPLNSKSNSRGRRKSED